MSAWRSRFGLPAQGRPGLARPQGPSRLRANGLAGHGPGAAGEEVPGVGYVPCKKALTVALPRNIFSAVPAVNILAVSFTI